MRTRRRHRLTRRQSEHLLNGPGGSDDLAQLLAAARPLRANGELPGEAAALAAFRSAAVDTRPRSSAVPPASLRRSLLVRVLAGTAAGVAVGGVAMAATGNAPGPLKVVPATSGAVHPTSGPSVVEDTPSDAAAPRTGNKTHPTSSPTDRPGRREDPAPAVGLCRAWSEITKNDGVAAGRSARFRELVDRVGDPAEVPSYCEEQTRTWCEGHHWPGPTPVQVDGKPVTVRCIKPTGRPTATPDGAERGPRSGSDRSDLPTHPAGKDSVRSAPLPTGAPVRN